MNKLCKKKNISLPIVTQFNYIEYWDNRYKNNGNSGQGSRGDLAKYKADFLNSFITQNDINSMIEFGCGDGYQIGLLISTKYLGFDVAKSSIELCKKRFVFDYSKSFLLYEPRYFINNDFISADLVTCLDVLYHIIDENDYFKTVQDIFNSAKKYVILYTNLYPQSSSAPHIIFRDTLATINNINGFTVERIYEPYNKESSIAQFIVCKRIL